jgi:hypothetical protein
MRKIFLILATFLFVGNTAFSKVEIGVGLMAGTKTKIDYRGEKSVNGGFHSRAKLNLTENLFVIGGYSYYLPYKFNNRGINYVNNNMVFNADMNLNFIDNGEVIVYGLGGLNMDLASSKYMIDQEQMKRSDSTIDYEFGFGIRIEICYAEIKFDNNKDQIQIFIGIDL